jgi:transposase
MDNASIHRLAVLKELFETLNAAGYGPFDLMFTPAHSPECNPVRACSRATAL